MNSATSKNLGPLSHPVLLFDGVCNLCNSTIQWIIRHDPKGIIHFAALQSNYAKEKLSQLNYNLEPMNSVILLDENGVFTKSEAIKKVLEYIMPKSIPGIFFEILPKSFRDLFYGWVAKNRYSIFGKKESCMVPTKEMKVRFESY